MSKVCGIYKITNMVNGKIIIGLSTNIIKRWRHYKYRLRQNKYDNPHLQNAWNKYGEQNFTFNILLLCPPDQLKKEEKRLIKKYNSNNPSIGYNLTTGGERPKFSKESREKMRGRWEKMTEEQQKFLSEKKSNEMRGTRNPFFGKHHTVKAKEKMSQERKGKLVSEETKKKIANSQLGKHHSEETKQKMRNKVVTPEQRKKISESKKGIPRSIETRKKVSVGLKRYFKNKKLNSQSFTNPTLISSESPL